MSFNNFIIVGNLVRKPEIINFGENKKKVTLQIIVNNKYKNKNNELIETTSLFFIDFYNNVENHNKYLDKGDQVVINGKLKSWYNDDEKKGGIVLVGKEIKYPHKKEKEEPSNDKLSELLG